MNDKKCAGIWGRLFGHRFVWRTFDVEYGPHDHCQRCGMPVGGWVK